MMRLRPYIVATFLLVLALATGLAYADHPQRLLLVLSDDSAPYQTTYETFRDTLLRSAGPAITFEIGRVVLGDDTTPEAAVHEFRPDLLIPIGAAAARAVRDHLPELPAFNILITHDAHAAIRGIETKGRSAALPRISALYLEQPLQRQFRLINVALPEARRVSVLIGSRFGDQLDELQEAARASGITLHAVDISTPANIVDAFNDALDHGDAILAFPDAETMTPNHAKWLLYMAYQREIPVFGFSRAMVDAGAFAALITTPDLIGREAAERVLQTSLDGLARGGQAWRLPPPDYPRYFQVAVNKAVSRALDMGMRDQQQIAQSLRILEHINSWQAGQ